MVHTYCTDSYKPQAGEIGPVINLIKLVFAFNIGFYALPFGEKVGFDVSFATLAAINALLLLPLIFMVFKGEKVSEKRGLPKEHGDL